MALPLRAPTLVPTTATGGSSPASNSPCRTPTCAAPLAPPPPSTHVRRAGPKIGYPAPLRGERLDQPPLPVGRGVRRELASPGPTPRGGSPPSNERVGEQSVR